MSPEASDNEVGRRGPRTPRGGTPGRILDALTENGSLDSDTAARYRSIPDAAARLVAEGRVSGHDVARARAGVFGLRYVKELPEPDAPERERLAALIPEKKLRRYGAVPVSERDGRLIVAVSDPSALYAMEDLRIISGRDVAFAVACEADILAALDRLFATPEEGRPQPAAEKTATDLLDDILQDAVSRSASDVHLEPTRNALSVRFRIDGVLEERPPVVAALAGSLVTRIKVLTGLDIAERRVPQDGRFTFDPDGSGGVDLRVATLPTTNGEGAVLRLLDRRSVELDLTKLGFSRRDLASYREVLEKPHGTVLVTGPTGSGKSTTLYATLAELNSPERKIVTIEDPVEYLVEGLTQVQVNPKAGLTFATGLRSILRADPDILMVGEIRDRDTARIAVEAALTGHLVFATLHTNDAPSALTRLTEMSVEPYLVASSVDFVIAQRLARRLCRKCRLLASIPPSTLPDLPEDLYPKTATFFAPTGCGSCGGTGYRGRLGVYEVMPVTEELSNLVAARTPAREIRRVAESSGMRSLRADGLLKAAHGLTSIEEVLRTTV
ncbi:GspE/PulE family protein [Rubrobacter indicoceani]|uniref:GspE/PulE family protein n=1 Tax=Rubrobacter indicoceani TaxID=2051957 RepID=UPI000E5C42BB|nr:GspE/PulE family protein [Rubrobacter indicoceani]